MFSSSPCRSSLSNFYDSDLRWKLFLHATSHNLVCDIRVEYRTVFFDSNSIINLAALLCIHNKLAFIHSLYSIHSFYTFTTFITLFWFLEITVRRNTSASLIFCILYFVHTALLLYTERNKSAGTFPISSPNQDSLNFEKFPYYCYS